MGDSTLTEEDLTALREKVLSTPIPKEETHTFTMALLESFEAVHAARSAREQALLEENEELKRKLQRYTKKREFKNTRFFHVPFCGTLAFVSTSGGWGPVVRVGVAFVALDRYLDADGDTVPSSLLLDQIDELVSRKAGDQFNRSLGRIISHGRAMKQRNYCSKMSPTEIEPYLDDLKAEIEDLSESAKACGVWLHEGEKHGDRELDLFGVDYLAFISACANVQSMMKALFIGGE